VVTQFRGRMLRRILLSGILSLILAGGLSGQVDIAKQDSETKIESRTNLNKGIKAFTDREYDAATHYFENAIQLDPDFEIARMYLATAYTSRFIPGSTDPQNVEMSRKGIETFTQVVDNAKDPSSPNKNAMMSITSLYYQLKRFDDSKEWCYRVLKAYPDNAEAYYRIAVMDYEYALDKTGMRGEKVKDLKPEDKAKVVDTIGEGLTVLRKALEVLPDYFDALFYQNLFLREKAKLEQDPRAKADLNLQADKLYQGAFALQLKAQEEAKKPKN
jgi:tetratricopeptide (TPR) repeat protein